MWLFTKYGFFSAVSAREGDGSHGRPVDPERIMVRARVREHLDDLKTRFPDLLDRCEIMESRHTDYAFRIFVGKPAWSQLLAQLSDETSYDNFKSEVRRHQGKAGAKYEHALHDVWDVMHRLQR